MNSQEAYDETESLLKLYEEGESLVNPMHWIEKYGMLEAIKFANWIQLNVIDWDDCWSIDGKTKLTTEEVFKIYRDQNEENSKGI